MVEGILLTVLAGLIWATVGVVMSHVASSGRSVSSFYATAGLLSAAMAAAFVVDWPVLLSGGNRDAGSILLWAGLTGVSNAVSKALMVIAMRRGHRGAIVAICNASMILPFVAAAILWRESHSTVSWVGVAGIVCALALLVRKGRSEEEGSPAASGWLLLVIVAFVILGLGRTAAGVPSKLGLVDAARLRPVAALLVQGVIHVAIMLKLRIPFDRRLLPHAVAWATLAVVSYVVLFRALDLLSPYDMMGIVFPTAVGICVVAFSIYSHLRLHEPYDRRTLTGLALALLGLGLIAVR
jgi:drug/metabolite transporter (DMT)-like permease